MRQISEIRTDQDTCDTSSRSSSDNDYPQHDIGFKVPLQIAEKIRTCDKSHRSYKEDQSHILHDLQCIRRKIRLSCYKIARQPAIQKAPVHKGNNKYTRRSQINSFNCYSADCIADRRNGKDRESKKHYRFDC